MRTRKEERGGRKEECIEVLKTSRVQPLWEVLVGRNSIRTELEGEGMRLDPLHVTLLTYSGICGVTAVGENARRTDKEKKSWS